MVSRHVTKKWFPRSPPIAVVLQELAHTCCTRDVELHVGHVRGLANDWADDLSRGRLEGFDPAMRVRVNVHAPSFWLTFSSPAPPGSSRFGAWEAQFRSQLCMFVANVAAGVLWVDPAP